MKYYIDNVEYYLVIRNKLLLYKMIWVFICKELYLVKKLILKGYINNILFILFLKIKVL